MSSQMLVTKPGSLLKADHRFDSELPNSQSKEGNKISCMTGFLCVKHKPTAPESSCPPAVLGSTSYTSAFSFVVVFIMQLIHVCCGENVRKCRQLRREKRFKWCIISLRRYHYGKYFGVCPPRIKVSMIISYRL